VDRFGAPNSNWDDRCARVQSKQSSSTAHGLEVPGDGALWEERHDATVANNLSAWRMPHASAGKAPSRLQKAHRVPVPKPSARAATWTVRGKRYINRIPSRLSR